MWDSLDVMRDFSCKTGAGACTDQVSLGPGKTNVEGVATCRSCCWIFRMLCCLCRGSSSGTSIVRRTIRQTCRTADGNCRESTVRYLSPAPGAAGKARQDWSQGIRDGGRLDCQQGTIAGLTAYAIAHQERRAPLCHRLTWRAGPRAVAPGRCAPAPPPCAPAPPRTAPHPHSQH